MLKKAFSKKLMLAAGILAAVTILCSQAFEQETNAFLAKIKAARSEQSSDTDKVIVATPADAVISGQAVSVDDVGPSLIREIIQEESESSERPPAGSAIPIEFFKTLFRVVISPQAP